jgi:hypothetical protein
MTQTAHYALLCPVRCEHMDHALATCDRENKVAFGSNMQKLFYDLRAAPADRQRVPKGTRVLIFITAGGNEGEALRKYYEEITGGCASYEATYVRWRCANAAGKHPEPKYRPASAYDTDTAYRGFWEVSDLRKLTTPIMFSELSGYDTKTKVTRTPRRPMRVDDRAV